MTQHQKRPTPASSEEWNVFYLQDQMLYILTNPQGYYGTHIEYLEGDIAFINTFIEEHKGDPGYDLTESYKRLVQQSETLEKYQQVVSYIDDMGSDYKDLLIRHVNLAALNHLDDRDAFLHTISPEQDENFAELTDFITNLFPEESEQFAGLYSFFVDEYVPQIVFESDGTIRQATHFDPSDDVFSVITLDYVPSLWEVSDVGTYIVDSLEADNVLNSALHTEFWRVIDFARSHEEEEYTKFNPNNPTATLEEWLGLVDEFFESEYSTGLVSRTGVEAAILSLFDVNDIETETLNKIAEIDGHNQFLTPSDTPSVAKGNGTVQSV